MQTGNCFLAVMVFSKYHRFSKSFKEGDGYVKKESVKCNPYAKLSIID